VALGALSGALAERAAQVTAYQPRGTSARRALGGSARRALRGLARHHHHRGVGRAVVAESSKLYTEAIRDLAPRLGAIKRLAELILAAPGRTLSGSELSAAIETAVDG
jgi:hypothetical protein